MGRLLVYRKRVVENALKINSIYVSNVGLWLIFNIILHTFNSIIYFNILNRLNNLFLFQ